MINMINMINIIIIINTINIITRNLIISNTNYTRSRKTRLSFYALALKQFVLVKL